MSVLYRTLRGIQRQQGNSLTRPPRNPITIQHLHRISHFLLQSQFATQDKYIFLSSCLIAFFGLLRVSEYTCPSQTRFDPSLHLCRGNISFSNDFSMVLVRLKASKTDPFRAGVTIRIAATHGNLCPVTALRSFLSLSQNTPGPLFVRSNGFFLTRRAISVLLTLALPDVPNLNTHSFRIGGASAAFSSGASDAMIRTLGRWSSDCYIRYIRVPDKDIAEFSKKRTETQLTTSVWDPDTWEL